MRKIPLVLFLLLFGFAADGLAQEWVQTNGPGAMGYNYIIKVVFNQKKDMFVLSSGDENLKTQAQLIRSTDKGNSWKTLLHVNPNNISDLAIAPNGDIYLSHFYSDSGITKSTDNGDSWENISNLGNLYAEKIIISRDGIIYVVAGKSADTNYLFYRSTDNGKTWDSLAILVPISAFGELAADSNSTLLISTDALILRSTDKGSTWSKEVVGLGGTKYHHITCGKNGNVYLEDDNYGFSMHSSNDGLTWTPLSIESGFIAFSPTGRILFEEGNAGALKYSDDSGITWNDYQGLKQWGINDLSPDFLCSDAEDGFYLQVNGLFLYSNHPGTWIPASVPLSSINALIVTTDNIFAATNAIEGAKYLTVSNDTGKSWTPIIDTAYPEAKWLVIDSNKGIIGGYGNVCRSTNDGKDWKRISDYGTDGDCCVVHQNGNIFLGTFDHGLFKSTDNGSSWKHLDTLKETAVYSISVDSAGDLYAGCGDGTFRSDDIGTTWSQFSIDTNYVIIHTAFDLFGDIFAGNESQGTPKGYRSYDNGKTWTIFTKGLDAIHKIHGLIAAPDGTVFAYTDNGIYFHAIGDCAWTSFSEGLSTMDIQSMAVNKEGDLFAGSNGSGVFRCARKFKSLTRLIPRVIPENVNFGTVYIKSNTCKDVVIKNGGNSPFILKSFTVTDSVPFSVAAESAKKLPVTINPKDSVVMTICFHPPQQAAYTSSILWNTDINDSLCSGIASESVLQGVATQKSIAQDILHNELTFSLHPNPSTGNSVMLSFIEELSQPLSLSVYDVLGTEVYRSQVAPGLKEFNIPIRDLSEGIYYVRIVVNGITMTKQFIKE
jgi:photosystem II stability/assembly factor-like uncharacterized protein